MLIKKIKIICFDFDGVFTDNKVLIDENGKESVTCSRFDGIGLRLLDDLNIKSYIISTEPNNVVHERAKKLKIECFNNCKDKVKKIKEIIRKLDLTLSEVCFVGNDINDILALKAVGLPIIVNDAHNDLLNQKFYSTSTNGGQGVVREICDHFYKSNDAS